MPEFFYTHARNNQARASEHFRVSPVAGSLGADIHDIDLNNLSEPGQATLRQALMDHGVLFIRDQDLSVEQLETVTQRFGQFGVEPYVKRRSFSAALGTQIGRSRNNRPHSPCSTARMYQPAAATPCSIICIWPANGCLIHCATPCTG